MRYGTGEGKRGTALNMSDSLLESPDPIVSLSFEDKIFYNILKENLKSKLS